MTECSETPLLVLDESSWLLIESVEDVGEELVVADVETTEMVPVLEIVEKVLQEVQLLELVELQQEWR